MEEAKAAGVKTDTSGFGPMPTKKNWGIQVLHSVAQRLGIAGTTSPEGKVSATIPPPVCQTPSSVGVSIPTIVELADIAAQLLSTKAARLTENQGVLTVTGKSHLFANLTPFTKKSSENARRFLEALVSRFQSGDEHDQEEARAALTKFLSSTWFKSVLKDDPSLETDMKKTRESLVQHVQPDATVLRDMVLFANLCFKGMMPLQVGDEKYLAMPAHPKKGTQALFFYKEVKGSLEKIGAAVVDSNTGKASIYGPDHTSMEYLSPELQDCMKAFSESKETPENAQKFLNFFAAQAKDPRVQKEAESGLLDLVTSEWFQRVLKANPKVVNTLITQANQILGIPSPENKNAWLLIQQALHTVGATTAEQVIHRLLQSIPEAHAEMLQTVAWYASILPKAGMSLQVGDQVYWAMPAQSPDGMAFGLYIAAGGQWQEAGSVVMDSQTGAIRSVFNPQHDSLDVLPPDLTDCMRVMAEKLSTMSDMNDALIGDGVKAYQARRIVDHWASQWKGCLDDPGEEGAVLQQYRGEKRIKGLKVRGEPGARYADYTFDWLGEGGLKRVKKMVTITPDGRVMHMARYTGKGGSTPKEVIFYRDIALKDAQHEVKIRETILTRGRSLLQLGDTPEEQKMFYMQIFCRLIATCPIRERAAKKNSIM